MSSKNSKSFPDKVFQKKQNKKPRYNSNAFTGKTTPFTELPLKKGGIPLYQRYLVPEGKNKTYTRKEALLMAEATLASTLLKA